MLTDDEITYLQRVSNGNARFSAAVTEDKTLLVMKRFYDQETGTLNDPEVIMTTRKAELKKTKTDMQNAVAVIDSILNTYFPG